MRDCHLKCDTADKIFDNVKVLCNDRMWESLGGCGFKMEGKDLKGVTSLQGYLMWHLVPTPRSTWAGTGRFAGEDNGLRRMSWGSGIFKLFGNAYTEGEACII